MPHSHVWHDTPHSHVWHDTFTCVTWHIHMCDMTHSHVWHDSFICVTWHIHMCDKISCMQHVCSNEGAMTHTCVAVCCSVFTSIHMCHTHACVMSHTQLSRVTQIDSKSCAHEKCRKNDPAFFPCIFGVCIFVFWCIFTNNFCIFLLYFRAKKFE